jgi:hypothetical protein
LALVRNRTDIEIETVPCGLDNYNYTNKDEIALKQVNVANCVKDKSKIKVKGTLYAANAQLMEVRVLPCIDNTVVNNINSTKCATFEEQAAWFNGVRLFLSLNS